MAYTTLQSVDDAARAMLTHRCRYRPGLKLQGPEACQVYKERANKNPMSPVGSLALLCNQWECPGPVEIETTHPQKPSEKSMEFVEGVDAMTARPTTNKQYAKPTVCSKCGLAPGATREDGSTVSFYPSRADQCKECIKSKDKGNGRNIMKSLDEIPANQEQPPVNPDNQEQIQKAFNKYPFILDWLNEQLSTNGGLECYKFELMMRIVAEQIPAEWFKSWMMRSVVKQEKQG